MEVSIPLALLLMTVGFALGIIAGGAVAFTSLRGGVR